MPLVNNTQAKRSIRVKVKTQLKRLSRADAIENRQTDNLRLPCRLGLALLQI